MSYIKSSSTFPSSNGTSTITYYEYTPTTKPKAILQISHGMCEYIERYETFADYLCKRGILVCGNDHLGHGSSVDSTSQLGYFAKKDGWTYLSQDLYTLTKIMRDAYPNTPCFLLGHSMGSFVARDYLSKYGDAIDGAIICGTSGGNPLSKVAIHLSDHIRKSKGEMFRSKMLNDLAFKAYNNRYEEKRTQYDWLSKDTTIIDRYIADKYCNFIFTASGFHDLFSLLDHVSSGNTYSKIPKKLPIRIISGDMDPVGDYGKGVAKVYKALQACGVEFVTMKLYKDARHEILNEVNGKEVFKDIYNWIISVMSYNAIY